MRTFLTVCFVLSLLPVRGVLLLASQPRVQAQESQTAKWLSESQASSKQSQHPESEKPLRIVVKGELKRECIFPHLPEFAVALTNVDPEQNPVVIQWGGDYRSGRQARWRFEVRDAIGRLMPTKEPPSIAGGGIYQMRPLGFDESWNTVLAMDRYVDLVPGDYALCIQYHNSITIADLESTENLSVYESGPIHLRVQRRVIDLNKQEREQAKECMQKLDDRLPLRILAGSYSEYAYDFIKPESPPGRLLTLGWKAVPSLLEHLSDEKLTPERRSWVLSLLFSITGWNDPRCQSDVLPSYQSRDAGWQVWGGLDGKPWSGGTGFVSTKYVWSWSKIDVTQQRNFAKQWQAFHSFIMLREQ